MKFRKVLFALRFHEKKGLPLLFNVWKKFKEECPVARLIIAGTGHEDYQRRL